MKCRVADLLKIPSVLHRILSIEQFFIADWELFINDYILFSLLKKPTSE